MHVPFRIGVAAALVAVFAAAPGTGAATACLRHECSNDVVVALGDEPRVGDETMRWSPVAGWDNRDCSDSPWIPCTMPGQRRCYEIASLPDYKTVRMNCEWAEWTTDGWRYHGPSTYFHPYKVSEEHFPRLGEDRRYVVRSCIGNDCSEWVPKTPQGDQDHVQFVGVEYECLALDGGDPCEEPCYPGAPTINSRIEDCP